MASAAPASAASSEAAGAAPSASIAKSSWRAVSADAAGCRACPTAGGEISTAVSAACAAAASTVALGASMSPLVGDQSSSATGASAGRSSGVSATALPPHEDELPSGEARNGELGMAAVLPAVKGDHRPLPPRPPKAAATSSSGAELVDEHDS
jgi:hypothetical protein